MSEKQESGPARDTSAPGGAPPVDGEPAAETASAGDDEFPVEVDDSDSDSGIAVEVEAAASDGDGSADLAAAEDKVQQLEKEKKELHDRLLRSAADLENFRRRSRKEIDDGKVEARSKVLTEMLPVMDNLDRAVDHAQQNDDAAKAGAQIVEGVQLVLRQFAQALERFDVKPVDARGLPFDPNVHEAIAQAPSTDESPAGTVVNVLQKGYTIGARLLRPAMVVVATGAPPASEASPAQASDEASGGAPDDGVADAVAADDEADATDGPAGDGAEGTGGADDSEAKA